MTEESGDNCLVRVRAQVMARDDSSDGWVPLSGGGLANVSVRKRCIPMGFDHQCSASDTASLSNEGCSSSSPPTTTKRKHEYLIHGKRTSDQSTVLSCTIKKDFEYNKVMPTFHRWRVGDKKFGLTFQTAADGRAFDEGVRRAVKELLEGRTDVTLHGNITEADDHDVFMNVTLPMQPSESCPHHGIRTPSYPSSYQEFPDSQKGIHYLDGSAVTVPPLQDPLGSNADTSSDNYPYVNLTYVSIIGDHKPDPFHGHDTENCLKQPAVMSKETKGGKNTMKPPLRCKHCQEVYTEAENRRGSCKYAPDPVKRGISTISCLPCAQCMLYHCMSDAEGDYSQDPCSCQAEEGCGRKWFGLTLLSLIVPCLWMYPPLRAAHWCGVTCGVCGEKHCQKE